MQLCCFSTSLEQADVCISCCSTGFAVTASPAKVAEQLCFGCQIGCCSTASSPWLHGGPGRTCPGASNGLCPISPRGCHHRCLPHRMMSSVAKQDCSKRCSSTLKHFVFFLLWSDNASTVFHITHRDRTKSTLLPQVSPDLQTLAASHLYSLRAMYIPGEQNQLADLFSCQKPSPG